MTIRFLSIIIVAILSVIFISGPALADDESDMGEMAELLTILEEETEVATKTKMNADYVPGIVTVLHGDDMEARGARTVWEAIAFVPGVETRVNDEGRPMVVVRGLSGSGHTGNMQLMINSVGANSSFRGVNDSLMMIPIEQVERIEVIRGAGSALYGEFAYSGVVNIIIRKEGKLFYGSAAEFDAYGAGGLYSYANPEKDLKFSVNVAGRDSGADVNSGLDNVEAMTGQAGISNSPGPVNEDEKVRSLAITLDYKKTSLSFYGVNRKHGAYFGTGGALGPESDRTPKDDLYWHLDLRQKLKINSALNGVLKVNISEDEKEDKQMRLPPGAITNPPPPPPGAPPLVPIFFPDGEFRTTYIKERRIEGGVDFTWSGWNGHEWLLGLSAAEVEVRDAWEATNVDLSTVPTPTVFTTIQRLPGDQDMWIDAGQKRRILSAVLQDQFELSDNFTMTVAARYDDFDDVGDAVTPRMAAVWKVGEPHLLKFQYSEAYRPPSLHELYLPETGIGPHGNPDVKPETSKTWEAGYIYRRPSLVGRATLFYSKMEDLIIIWRGSPNEHRPLNSDEVDLKGIELEIEKQIGERWKTIANLSFLDAEDVTNHHDVMNSTELIGNLILEGKVADNLLAVLNYRHVGDRKRSSTDTRDDLEGYDTVDLTLNRFNLGFKGLTVRVGLKNIFDAEVKSPNDRYQGDLPRPGRTWWTQVSRQF